MLALKRDRETYEKVAKSLFDEKWGEWRTCPWCGNAFYVWDDVRIEEHPHRRFCDECVDFLRPRMRGRLSLVEPNHLGTLSIAARDNDSATLALCPEGEYLA